MLSPPVTQDEDFLPLPNILVTMTKEYFSHYQPAIAILDLSSIKATAPKAAESWLHPKEQEQLLDFKYKKRNTEWLGGRICAKQGFKIFSKLQGEKGLVPAATSFAVLSHESGKPFFSSLDKNQNILFPQLSISHSKALATALCASVRCGIDIQYQSASLVKVREKFVVSKEQQIIKDKLPDLPLSAQLSLIWAGKEALKKMTSSTGMPGFLDLRLERVIYKNARSALLLFAETRRYNQTYPVIAGMLNDAYGMAICCENKAPYLND